MDIEAHIITMAGNSVSEKGAEACIKSSQKFNNDFDIKIFDATVISTVDARMKDFKLKWNYPWEGQIADFKTGLTKSAYKTNDPRARVACAVSHYRLWHACAHGAAAYLVLEHDAIWEAKLDNNITKNDRFEIIGINNPLFATRKSRDYAYAVNQYKNKKDIIPCPTIDKHDIPQGLAGNSAYIIKPTGAKQMLRLVEDHGLWPNDALMCKQLVKGLGVSTKFYTTIQGLPSTTT